VRLRSRRRFRRSFQGIGGPHASDEGFAAKSRHLLHLVQELPFLLALEAKVVRTLNCQILEPRIDDHVLRGHSPLSDIIL